MKVVLSRKGFDSNFGGYASFILPDNTLQSLPIPCSGDKMTYAGARSCYQDKNLMELMLTRKGQVKEKEWKTLDGSTHCHLDPDIDYGALKREKEWRGCFGQIGAAQTVLDHAGVGENDLFLFFGWFREWNPDRENSSDRKKGSDKHVIFGYLQVEKTLRTTTDHIPEWLQYHPHASGHRASDSSNCIYIARETCSWDERIPGYGVFRYSSALDLTKPGMSRSKWMLPNLFQGVSIAYHTQESWKEGYFQSASIGQEFVIAANDEVEKWAREIIEVASPLKEVGHRTTSLSVHLP